MSVVVVRMARERQIKKEFITIYKDSPCLWQMSSTEFRDPTKTEEAFQKLERKLKQVNPEANRDTALKTIHNMRSAYRKELKKVQADEGHTSHVCGISMRRVTTVATP